MRGLAVNDVIRPEYFQYVELCDEIIQRCVDVPERGEQFAEDVTLKAESIKASVQRHCHATPAQIIALEGMHRAVLRWIED